MRVTGAAISLCVLAVTILAGSGVASARDPFAGENAQGSAAFAERFALLGEVSRPDARTIAANSFSVGVETFERGYSTYAQWAPYLGALGVKRARLMAGWAYLEPNGDGLYDFTRLDPVVDDIRRQGVQPWMGLTYGNRAIPDAGTALRDSPLPSGAGRTAWLAFVRAMVVHYRGRIREWEIWNEPDLNPHIEAADYGAFAAETARVIRDAQSDAVIIIGAFTTATFVADDPEQPPPRAAFAKTALETFVQRGGAGLAQAVTYHAYTINPDSTYERLASFAAMVRAIDPTLQLRQGENGAPSINQQLFALKNTPWTEESQAKWALRRMLGDYARGIPTSLFTLVDLHYPVREEANAVFVTNETQRAAAWSKNAKGLLQTGHAALGQAGDDQRVLRAKAAYRALQSLTAIFDDRLQPVAHDCRVAGSSAPLAVFAFRRADGAMAIAIWRTRDRPGADPTFEGITLVCAQLQFAAAPRYIDLLTGAVYATNGVASVTDRRLILRDVPIYDSPIVLADPRLAPLS